MEELREWIVAEDDQLLVVNKPGDVVCHPSKDGPRSSLVGIVREYLGGGSAHLIFRLDRETSGLVVFAKDQGTARTLQIAAQERRYKKVYYALLVGELSRAVTVDRALGPDRDSPVLVKSRGSDEPGAQPAVSCFAPVAGGGGYTLAEVITKTGRKHQIRAHAQEIGFPVVGDKIYGPDSRLFLQFIESGWTSALAERLKMPRHALHCQSIDLSQAGFDRRFSTSLPADMTAFCGVHGIHVPPFLA